MKKKIFLLFRFYRRVAFPFVLVSAAIIFETRQAATIPVAVALKIVTLAMMLTFCYFYQYKREFFYYKNLGMGSKALLTSVGILDGLFFCMALIAKVWMYG